MLFILLWNMRVQRLIHTVATKIRMNTIRHKWYKNATRVHCKSPTTQREYGTNQRVDTVSNMSQHKQSMSWHERSKKLHKSEISFKQSKSLGQHIVLWSTNWRTNKKTIPKQSAKETPLSLQNWQILTLKLPNHKHLKL